MFDVFPEKLFPTTAPMTDPTIAPAIKSENQWMVIEIPSFNLDLSANAQKIF